jgi:hypothetical protein
MAGRRDHSRLGASYTNPAIDVSGVSRAILTEADKNAPREQATFTKINLPMLKDLTFSFTFDPRPL